jgi:predicted flap endonuclease-1-like 5' DNA nuclease
MILLQLDPLTRPVAISEMLLLLAGAAFVGWLLARWIMSGRVDGLREAIIERQSELDDCQVRVKALSTSTPVSTVASQLFAESNTIVTPVAIESVADDLKKVEGIGPKIEGLLNADGIRTFAKLAATHPQHIAGLLSAAGPRFQIHNPETWPEQAALARDGKWDELKALQKGLVGGRE